MAEGLKRALAGCHGARLRFGGKQRLQHSHPKKCLSPERSEIAISVLLTHWGKIFYENHSADLSMQLAGA
jgi:hypothetical protein